MTWNVFKAQRFVYCDVDVCYGTTVEHGSLLNRSGICQKLSVVISFCSYSRFEYKNNILFGKNTCIIMYYAIDSVKRDYFCVCDQFLLSFLGD